MTKIQRKKIDIEILEQFVNSSIEWCEREIHEAKQIYKVVGKRQAYKWENSEQIYLWEDEAHTIPKMVDKWDSVERTEEEMTEEICAKIDYLKKIIKKLEAIE